jgi:hypothetical protein
MVDTKLTPSGYKIMKINHFEGKCSYLLGINYLCSMLNVEEEKFLDYWSKNREQQKTSIRPFLVGLSAGFILGISLLIGLSSGWYERASMEANSKMSSFVFLMAILAISFFMAFFYRKFKWEMQEQRYLELLAAKNKK